MAKGDWVKVAYNAGDVWREETFTADQNGRTVEYDIPSKGWIEVVVRTRGGTAIERAQFKPETVLAVTSKISGND